jgi:hypothetical protein
MGGDRAALPDEALQLGLEAADFLAAADLAAAEYSKDRLLLCGAQGGPRVRYNGGRHSPML